MRRVEDGMGASKEEDIDWMSAVIFVMGYRGVEGDDIW